VVEFYFTHSKLTEQAFCAKNVIGKYTVSKSMGVLGLPAHLPTPMLNNISAVVFIIENKQSLLEITLNLLAVSNVLRININRKQTKPNLLMFKLLS